MRAKAKQILITTETCEVTIVRQIRRDAIRGFCPNCGLEVELLSFDSAETLSGLSGRELFSRTEQGDVLPVELDSGT